MTHDSNNLKTRSAAPASSNAAPASSRENDVEALLGAIREIQNHHLDRSPVARRICDGIYVVTLLPVVVAALACLGVAFAGSTLARGVVHLFRRSRPDATSTTEEPASDVRRSLIHGHAVVS